MKVLFIPSSKDNPYQKLLATALSEKGVNVDSSIGFSSSSIRLLYSMILAVIRKRIPDIIHVHWLLPFVKYKNSFLVLFDGIIFLVTMLFCRLMKIKIIWTVHNLQSHDAASQKIEFFISHYFIKLCNTVIVHSETAKSKFINYFGLDGNKIKIIPHGNFISYYKNEVSRDEACKYLKLDPGKKIILFFGKIRPYKDIEGLIKCFQNIADANSILLIVGKPANNFLEKQITNLTSKSNNISLFLRYIPDDDVQYFMNASDLVVLPYKKIFTSGTLFLAMSFARAIIAPDLGIIPDLLDDKGGIIYTKGELEQALLKIFEKNTEKCGEYNYQKITALSWDRIAAETCRAYKSSLEY